MQVTPTNFVTPDPSCIGILKNRMRDWLNAMMIYRSNAQFDKFEQLRNYYNEANEITLKLDEKRCEAFMQTTELNSKILLQFQNDELTSQTVEKVENTTTEDDEVAKRSDAFEVEAVKLKKPIGKSGQKLKRKKGQVLKKIKDVDANNKRRRKEFRTEENFMDDMREDMAEVEQLKNVGEYYRQMQDDYYGEMDYDYPMYSDYMPSYVRPYMMGSLSPPMMGGPPPMNRRRPRYRRPNRFSQARDESEMVERGTQHGTINDSLNQPLNIPDDLIVEFDGSPTTPPADSANASPSNDRQTPSVVIRDETGERLKENSDSKVFVDNPIESNFSSTEESVLISNQVVTEVPITISIENPINILESTTEAITDDNNNKTAEIDDNPALSRIVNNLFSDYIPSDQHTSLSNDSSLDDKEISENIFDSILGLHDIENNMWNNSFSNRNVSTPNFNDIAENVLGSDAPLLNQTSTTKIPTTETPTTESQNTSPPSLILHDSVDDDDKSGNSSNSVEVSTPEPTILPPDKALMVNDIIKAVSEDLKDGDPQKIERKKNKSRLSTEDEIVMEILSGMDNEEQEGVLNILGKPKDFFQNNSDRIDTSIPNNLTLGNNSREDHQDESARSDQSLAFDLLPGNTVTSEETSKNSSVEKVIIVSENISSNQTLSVSQTVSNETHYESSNSAETKTQEQSVSVTESYSNIRKENSEQINKQLANESVVQQQIKQVINKTNSSRRHQTHLPLAPSLQTEPNLNFEEQPASINPMKQLLVGNTKRRRILAKKVSTKTNIVTKQQLGSSKIQQLLPPDILQLPPKILPPSRVLVKEQNGPSLRIVERKNNIQSIGMHNQPNLFQGQIPGGGNPQISRNVVGMNGQLNGFQSMQLPQTPPGRLCFDEPMSHLVLELLRRYYLTSMLKIQQPSMAPNGIGSTIPINSHLYELIRRNFQMQILRLNNYRNFLRQSRIFQSTTVQPGHTPPTSYIPQIPSNGFGLSSRDNFLLQLLRRKFEMLKARINQPNISPSTGISQFNGFQPIQQPSLKYGIGSNIPINLHFLELLRRKFLMQTLGMNNYRNILQSNGILQSNTFVPGQTPTIGNIPQMPYVGIRSRMNQFKGFQSIHQPSITSSGIGSNIPINPHILELLRRNFQMQILRINNYRNFLRHRIFQSIFQSGQARPMGNIPQIPSNELALSLRDSFVLQLLRRNFEMIKRKFRMQALQMNNYRNIVPSNGIFQSNTLVPRQIPLRGNIPEMPSNEVAVTSPSNSLLAQLPKKSFEILNPEENQHISPPIPRLNEFQPIQKPSMTSNGSGSNIPINPYLLALFSRKFQVQKLEMNNHQNILLLNGTSQPNTFVPGQTPSMGNILQSSNGHSLQSPTGGFLMQLPRKNIEIFKSGINQPNFSPSSVIPQLNGFQSIHQPSITSNGIGSKVPINPHLLELLRRNFQMQILKINNYRNLLRHRIFQSIFQSGQTHPMGNIPQMPSNGPALSPRDSFLLQLLRRKFEVLKAGNNQPNISPSSGKPQFNGFQSIQQPSITNNEIGSNVPMNPHFLELLIKRTQMQRLGMNNYQNNLPSNGIFQTNAFAPGQTPPMGNTHEMPSNGFALMSSRHNLLVQLLKRKFEMLRSRVNQPNISPSTGIPQSNGFQSIQQPSITSNVIGSNVPINPHILELLRRNFQMQILRINNYRNLLRHRIFQSIFQSGQTHQMGNIPQMPSNEPALSPRDNFLLQLLRRKFEVLKAGINQPNISPSSGIPQFNGFQSIQQPSITSNEIGSNVPMNPHFLKLLIKRTQMQRLGMNNYQNNLPSNGISQTNAFVPGQTPPMGNIHKMPPNEFTLTSSRDNFLVQLLKRKFEMISSKMYQPNISPSNGIPQFNGIQSIQQPSITSNGIVSNVPINPLFLAILRRKSQMSTLEMNNYSNILAQTRPMITVPHIPSGGYDLTQNIDESLFKRKKRQIFELGMIPKPNFELPIVIPELNGFQSKHLPHMSTGGVGFNVPMNPVLLQLMKKRIEMSQNNIFSHVGISQSNGLQLMQPPRIPTNRVGLNIPQINPYLLELLRKKMIMSILGHNAQLNNLLQIKNNVHRSLQSKYTKDDKLKLSHNKSSTVKVTSDSNQQIRTRVVELIKKKIQAAPMKNQRSLSLQNKVVPSIHVMNVHPNFVLDKSFVFWPPTTRELRKQVLTFVNQYFLHGIRNNATIDQDIWKSVNYNIVRSPLVMKLYPIPTAKTLLICIPIQYGGYNIPQYTPTNSNMQQIR